MSLGKTSLDLLGYEISQEGITVQSAKTHAIAKLPTPTTVTELISFLGMTSYYRQLVPHFAQIAQPLYRLTSKNVKWLWGHVEKRAFEQLKDSLVSSKIMAYPDTSKPYILYTDCSDYALGVIPPPLVKRIGMVSRGRFTMSLSN